MEICRSQGDPRVRLEINNRGAATVSRYRIDDGAPIPECGGISLGILNGGKLLSGSIHRAASPDGRKENGVVKAVLIKFGERVVHKSLLIPESVKWLFIAVKRQLQNGEKNAAR